MADARQIHRKMSGLEPVAQIVCASWSCLAFLLTFLVMKKVRGISAKEKNYTLRYWQFRDYRELYFIVCKIEINFQPGLHYF